MGMIKQWLMAMRHPPTLRAVKNEGSALNTENARLICNHRKNRLDLASERVKLDSQAKPSQAKPSQG